MFILTQKHLFFLLSFLFINLINTTTLAQPRPFFYYRCQDATTYTNDSAYQTNLETALSALPTTNSGFGYFNFTTGQGNDRVVSFALCRGDVDPTSCRNCVNESIAKLPESCPNQIEAIGYHDECFLKYSNNTGTPDDWVVPSPKNTSDVDRFNADLRILMDRLRGEAAAGGPLLKFATGNITGPAFSTIYALQQCTPDLSEQACSDCLEAAINRIPNSELYGRDGGRILQSMCNFRYEVFNFFNQTTTLPVSPPSPSSPPGKKQYTKRIVLIVVLVAVFVVIVVVVKIISPGILMRFKQNNNRQRLTSQDQTNQAETMVSGTTEQVQYNFSTIKAVQYVFSTIKAATNDFSENNKLGEGGFGSVYEGTLVNKKIAVKRLKQNSEQGENEFKNEVSVVLKTQHINLVQLLGFVIEGRERLLIYELLPNRSLDKFIFDPDKRALLDWETRYSIIKGIASGLQYLHEYSCVKIIHRDMKASNVLLDANMNPIITDFGTARMFKPEESQANTSRIIGTNGYMAPEYMYHGHFSNKSDVFSFGVLMLEMITGRENKRYHPNISEDLLSFVWRSWKNGNALDVVDPTLNSISHLHAGIIRRSIHIGLLCVHENDNNRPTMTDVFVMLHNFSHTLPHEPREPAFSFFN